MELFGRQSIFNPVPFDKEVYFIACRVLTDRVENFFDLAWCDFTCLVGVEDTVSVFKVKVGLLSQHYFTAFKFLF